MRNLAWARSLLSSKRTLAAVLGLSCGAFALTAGGGAWAEVVPPSKTLSYKGGKAALSVPVTGTGPTLVVTPLVTSGAAWLTVEPTSATLTVKLNSSGTGKAKVAFRASPNGSVDARTGAIDVAGVTLTVSQLGAPCAVSLGAKKGAAGGTRCSCTGHC